MKLSEIVEFNPKTSLKKGAQSPHIDMSSLPTNERYVTSAITKEYSGSGSKFIDGDTLFARITPCLENGKGGYVHGLGAGVVGHGSTEFIVMRPKIASDTSFVYYVTRHPEFRKFAERHMSGTSGRQRVSWQALADFELPDIGQARRESAADVLTKLDRKIYSNERTNETLEEMARAIFKDWFVDFGPVRAKMEGREPYLSREIWDLFPDRLDDEGKPGAWGRVTLGELAELKYGKALKAQDRNEGDVPVYGSNGQVDWHNRSLVEGPGVVVGRKGNAGAVTYVEGKFFPIDTTFYVVPRSKDWDIRFLWLLMERLNLPGLAADSAVPGLNRNFALGAECIKPDPRVIESFSGITTPIMQRIARGGRENEKLAQLRDFLLPWFMSGDIEIKDGNEKLEVLF